MKVFEYRAPTGAAVIMFRTSGDTWAGYPRSANGHKCPFGVVVRGDGAAVGGGAINFLAAGGWGPGFSRPGREERAEVQKGLLRAFVSAAVAAEPWAEDDVLGLLAYEAGPEGSGRGTVAIRASAKTSMGRDQRLLLAAAGVRPAHVMAAEYLGVALLCDPAEIAQASVGNFCEVVDEAKSTSDKTSELLVTSGVDGLAAELFRDNRLGLKIRGR